MEEYLTVKETSSRIKMAPGTIRNLVWKNVFRENYHYVKPTPRKILFIWSRIEAWLYSEDNTEPNALLKKNSQTKTLINI